jgi:hypothetical protein
LKEAGAFLVKPRADALGAEAEEERVAREHAESGRLRANAPLATTVNSSSRNVQPKFDVEVERTAAALKAAANTAASEFRRVEHTDSSTDTIGKSQYSEVGDTHPLQNIYSCQIWNCTERSCRVTRS